MLIEAIEASYALGYVEAIFRSSANPTAGAISVMKRFARRASRHWFRHATSHGLLDVKVYQFVLDRLAVNFRSALHTMMAKGMSPFPAYVHLDMGKPRGSMRLMVRG